ncbi:MAG TPA: UDP-N-acetylmuramoyl-L-alanyl-D-glutamate--2,6-diaminopimelate ligase [Alphaproteobacteria bacterium]|nr:UDP-N-acetylmuramoyl-L-alanyl-D-glutamate--2,6-diaminopimelate ligase [Alphaproteobacteria bacterium]USO04818.1 MAG: UDP-N-acetylmuramoyl-L-alanyl-D-glutamate--2,6-diaminopimelate ligase [Rhodospirillales bacterium]HOO80882.1 UDP-N-acetylmuramoyl-L-alanyl-D-glutamate--2,6-diaminopimelate ligase [Alphaproteobacteria bacterium]
MNFDVSTIKGLSEDSRAVKKGYLFAALPGCKVDGRDYINAAIEHGASVILAPEGTQLPPGVKDVKLLTDPNPRQALAKLAAQFYARQPEHIAVVSGTNGKTSTTLFVQQLWTAAGYNAASLGTLGVRCAGVVKSGAMTTPGPVALQAGLAELAAEGVTHLAMEASSHGLDQYRLDGVEFEAAGFTNLSHDHLDYHGSMEEYFTAKARLFEELLPESGVAVLNADIPEFEKLQEICKRRGVKILSYGHHGKDLKILSVKPAGHGQDLELGITGAHKDITLPLVGEFQVMNALCALGLVIANDPAKKEIYIEALEKLQGAPGRLQLVPGHPGAAVYVDYAHTPDALENILKALRPHTKGKLVCVFGCGGNRDKAKRPVMGAVAGQYADLTIVTDDNPRGENPADIRAAILSSVPSSQQIADRREAITTAITQLETGDVLVIAGKGHEQGQIFASHTTHFDDVEEAGKAIAYLEHQEPSKEEEKKV